VKKRKNMHGTITIVLFIKIQNYLKYIIHVFVVDDELEERMENGVETSFKTC